MIRIETDRADDHLTLRVAGRLCGACVAALEECWNTERQRSPAGEPSIDLSEVTFVDRAGWCLLRRMHRDGVAVFAKGLATHTIKDELAENEEQRP